MTIQQIQFKLMKAASFNDFNGARVVDDLKRQSNLWKGAVMDRSFGTFVSPDELKDRPGSAFGGQFYVGGIDLIKLRDIHEDAWNVDTLFITPVAGKEDALERLAKTWQADEVDWIGGEEADKMLGHYSPETRNNPKQILRIWWD